MTLTPEEARIVLNGLDAMQTYGWTGAPYTAALQSAIDKLEAQAGDLEQATVHPLQQKLEP
jgi:predicted DNA-binding transcriptional regulator YafY